MRRLLLCLILIGGCETEAAAPTPGFVPFAELERSVATSIEETIARFPTETEGRTRVDFLPRTLGEARRLIEELEDRDLEPFHEACEMADWLVLSQVEPGAEGRFGRGWAIERSTLRIYSFQTMP